MYELINTSIPNGLLPGTHGFSTVAMTKGMPDALRARVEGLCAYNHRTNAHDGTYSAENPTNWLHAVLPQGVHAVGCIAPSDFDYTGRTNRIARIRLFNADEMPDVGGAEVALAERAWFQEPWIGEARYLADDKVTCIRLRDKKAKVAHEVPNWVALFGGDGSRLAQRFAWQLQKNLSSGGKTIWFKASTQWDVTGERLLGLFSDLIALLPPQVRKAVTFSTYAAALPAGVTCHLRGVYDDDKMFVVASSMSAWVDCENGKVVHPELLPDNGAEIVASTVTTGVGERSSKLQQPVGVRENALRHLPKVTLIAPQQAKKSMDPFLVAMAALCVAVIVGFGGVAIWMYRANAEKMCAHGAAQALEQQKDKARAEAERREKEEKERFEKESRERKEREEAERKAKEEQARVEKERQEQEKRAEAERKEKEENDRLEKERQEQEKRAEEERKARDKEEEELDNVKTVVGAPPLPDERKMRNAQKYQEKKIEVFYYVDGVVTNQIARFNAKKSPMPDSISQWEILIGAESLKPTEVADKFKGSPVVVWFYDNARYFDWKCRKDATEEDKQWFAHADKRNIREMIFGEDKRVFKWWKEVEQYDILITWLGSAYPLKWQKECLGKDDVCKFVKEQRIKRIESEIERKKGEVLGLKTEVEKARSKEKDARDKLERLDALCDELRKVEGQLRLKPKPDVEKGLKKHRANILNEIKDQGRVEDEYKRMKAYREQVEKNSDRVDKEIGILEEQRKTAVTKDDVKGMKFEVKYPETAKEDL